MRKTASICRHLLALVLAAAIVFGTCAAALPGFVLRAAAASVKAADITCGDLTFVVPEVIYLYPDALSSAQATSTPFQFYVNNNSDGSVKAGTTTTETTGYIYYSFSGASTATITYQFYNEALSSTLSGTANLSSSTITSGSSVSITGGQSPSLAKDVNGCYIEWTLSFTDSADNTAKKAYAYTYVYKPYTVPVATAMVIGCSDSWTHSFRYAGSITWISGFEDLQEGSSVDRGDWDNHAFQYSNFSNFSAFISQGSKGYVGGSEVTGSQAYITSGFTVSPSSTGGSLGYVVFSDGGSYKLNTSPSNAAHDSWGTGSKGTYTSQVKNLNTGYYYKTGEAKVSGNLYNDTYGKITIDTSRYSNLNQIPNLAVGMEVFNDQNTSSNSANWYVADYTDLSLDGYDTWHTNGTGYYGTFNYKIASQGTNYNSTGFYESEGVRYCGAWPRTFLGNTGTQGATKMYMIKGTYATKQDANPQNYEVCKLQATYYNKATLRSAVMNATKAMAKLGITGKSAAAMPTSCYFDADTNYKWTAFQSAYKAAVIGLTKLNSTSNPDTLATNLTNALDALCTKVSFDANGGTFSSTTPVYVEIGTNQSVSHTIPSGYTATRSGYTFGGWSTDSAALSGGVMPGSNITVGYNNTLYAVWLPHYQVAFDGNGNTGGTEMTNQSFVYGTAQDLKPNTYTRSYTVTYKNNNGTADGSDTATYAFAGWKGSVRLISDFGNEYSKDYTSGSSSTYQEIKQYTIAPPFAANEVFHLEFDAKGSGQLTNYFYGASNYWQIASGVNNAGQTFTGSDGNVRHALTSSYQHYSVTWTLKSSGSANVEKYVLFRVFGGNSATVKNIEFWKETGSVSYSDEQSVNNLCTTSGAIYQMRAQWTPGSVTLPTPSYTGYTFGGWYSDENCTTLVGAAGDSYTPTANTTLYAKWTPIDYTITYVYEGTVASGYTAPAAVTGKHVGDNMPADPTLPSVPGYTITGWTYSPAITNGKMPASNVTATATWSMVDYTITYVYAGTVASGYTAPAAVTGKHVGDNMPADPTLPSVPGYTITGWTYSPAITNGKMPASNVTATATWSMVDYTITYVYAGTVASGYTAPAAVTGKHVGDNMPADPTLPSVDGYTITGWTYSPAIVNGKMPASNVTATATWSMVDYTITYVYAGTVASGYSAPAAVTGKHVGDNMPADPALPNVTGYTITGWTYSPAIVNGKMPASNVTATATWSLNNHTITYVTGGGSAVAQDTVNYGAALPSRSSSLANAVFNGWVYTGNSATFTGTTMPDYDLTATAQWIFPVTDDTFILSSNRATNLNVLSNDEPDTALVSVGACAGFTTAVSNGKVVVTPSGAISSAVTFTYTASYNGSGSYTATVTLVPASDVYYEESGFITFESSTGAPAWQNAGTEYSGVFEEGLRPGATGSPMTAYQTTNETTYSLGNAKYVEVSAANKGGATATFTFSGTGFDFYSVTDNQSGLAFVDVYKVENGQETNVESTLINTYFGYKYGRLYLKDNAVSLDSSGTPIYNTSETGSGTFFIEGERRGTTTPTDEGFAYGWVAGSNEITGVYQVPVISWSSDTGYGTYKVVIEPRWSARQNLTGNSSYRFYVDAVRVYNPIDPSTMAEGTSAYEAYMADGEYGACYQSVRDLLINADSFGATGTAGNAGVAFLEPGVEVTVKNYKAVGPKNEVYLEPGQAIAFNLTTAAQTVPAKLSVGLRLAQGTTGGVTVYSKDTTGVPLTVSGATELYRDITEAVTWQSTTGSACTTSAPIIIANTSANDSGAVISITNLKWSYDTEVTPASRMLSFSFSPQDLVTASAVMRQTQTVTPDTPAAPQTPQPDALSGRRMITLQALMEQIFGRIFETLRLAFFKK